MGESVSRNAALNRESMSKRKEGAIGGKPQEKQAP